MYDIGSFGHHNPALLSRFINGKRRRPETRISKGSNWNGNYVGKIVHRVIGRGTTGGAKVKTYLAAFITHANIDRGAARNFLDILAFDTRLCIEKAARALLAGQAMTNGNPHRLALARY